eukprot:6027517-Amphidinium_carterae.1
MGLPFKGFRGPEKKKGNKVITSAYRTIRDTPTLASHPTKTIKRFLEDLSNFAFKSEDIDNLKNNKYELRYAFYVRHVQ